MKKPSHSLGSRSSKVNCGPLTTTASLSIQPNLSNTNNIFVCHIGELQLSAVSISLSVIGNFPFGFMLGMGSALETLCGQAIGAGQVHMLGIYMQRCWLILLVSCLVILPVYIFAGPLLKLLGQDLEIANLAGKFTIMTIPQLFSLAINFPTQKFLQAQSKVDIIAWIGFIALIIHISMLWLFIPVFGWGLPGAAAAFNIINWGMTIAQVAYVFGRCKDAWLGFSSAAFKEIWAFVRLSFASALMLCLEIWYFMSIILPAGHLDNAVIAVGSLSVCTNANGFQAMIFIGINAAIRLVTLLCHRVLFVMLASLLMFVYQMSSDQGDHKQPICKYSVYVRVFQSLLIGLLCMVLILIARDYFAVIFTNIKELQQAVAHVAWLLGITMVLNDVQPVISGVAVGGGWQALVAYINLGSYYVFGIPLGFILGYVANFGVTGIWGGLIAGTSPQTSILLFVVYQTNWNKEVEETNNRMRKWGDQVIETNKIDDELAINTSVPATACTA
ncbi:hypothetical protein Cgig2_023245 [Carnegiea gigantea]|uniref:Protein DETOXIFICATION n=1 Tax=Carnegiea gigantea TaxID=171969 RepID=A0A9Q1GZK5_9CARY|nr:hypothetical protein Cgig2_023245 [Carnegiea gigantea]